MTQVSGDDYKIVLERSRGNHQVGVCRPLATNFQSSFQFPEPFCFGCVERYSQEQLPQVVYLSFALGAPLTFCRTLVQLADAHTTRAEFTQGNAKQLLPNVFTATEVKHQRVGIKQIGHLQINVTAK